MTFGQFWSILRARKWIALLVLVLIVGSTLAVSMLLPKQYTGTSSVVVDVKPDPISALGYSMSNGAGFLATQVDILKSERVILRVIRDLRLLENPQIQQQWNGGVGRQGTIEQWLTETLQGGLEVKPSRESNVINVSYMSPDARFASGMANAFAQAYIATTLELRVDPAKQFTTFFNAQTKDARDALEKAQSRLSAFQRAKGIIATDERLDIETARLNELSSQVTQLQAQSADSGSRQVQALGTSSDRLQEVLNNGLIAGLTGDLARAEARLQELTQRLGNAHPQVQEARASIAELRTRIAAETRRVTGGVGVTNTINKGREAQVARELELQRAKVLQTKAVRDDGLVLQREVENAQKLYDSVTARLSQTSMESQATQSYANMLTLAQPPVRPSSPRVFINTLVAVAIGVLASIGLVLLLEVLDRRVRATDDVVQVLGIPVLGVLPRPGTKRYHAGYLPSFGNQLAVGMAAPRLEAKQA